MTANKRNPPPDTRIEAEFRAYAREWAGYVLAPERTDDAALDTAIMAGADLAGFATALRTREGTAQALRRQGLIAGHHQHYARNKYIIGLCGAAEGAGIERRGRPAASSPTCSPSLGHKSEPSHRAENRPP